MEGEALVLWQSENSLCFPICGKGPSCPIPVLRTRLVCCVLHTGRVQG